MLARSLVLVVVVALLASGYLLYARRPAAPKRTVVSTVDHTRQTLFQEIQPVALKNCDLQRFGEANDGGYLMCANLLDSVGSGYSYGISGYDGWGCDVSQR